MREAKHQAVHALVRHDEVGAAAEEMDARALGAGFAQQRLQVGEIRRFGVCARPAASAHRRFRSQRLLADETRFRRKPRPQSFGKPVPELRPDGLRLHADHHFVGQLLDVARPNEREPVSRQQGRAEHPGEKVG